MRRKDPEMMNSIQQYISENYLENAGVEEGDVLVIRKNAEPHIGDIVVALDENQQSTLKRYGGIDQNSRRAVLEYVNRDVYGDKVILVRDLVC